MWPTYTEAVELARSAIVAGEILDWWTERGSTGSPRYVMARSDQGDFVWWEPEPMGDDW